MPDADLAGGQGCLNGCSMTCTMCPWIVLVPLHHLCWYHGTACPIGPPSLWLKRSQIFPDLNLCIDAIEVGTELSQIVMQRGPRHIVCTTSGGKNNLAVWPSESVSGIPDTYLANARSLEQRLAQVEINRSKQHSVTSRDLIALPICIIRGCKARFLANFLITLLSLGQCPPVTHCLL